MTELKPVPAGKLRREAKKPALTLSLVSRLILKFLCIYAVLNFPVYLAISLANRWNIPIDTSTSSHITVFKFFISILLSIFLLPQKLRRRFILIHGGNRVFLYAFLIPFIIGCTMNYLISIKMLLPTLIGLPPIQTAVNQANIDYGSNSFNYTNFIFNGYLPALNEETYCKFVWLVFIYLICVGILRDCLLNSRFWNNQKSPFMFYLRKIGTALFRFLYKGMFSNRYRFFIIKKKGLLVHLSFVFISAYYFAIGHLPDASNLFMYFIPGLVYSYMILRYGLLSAFVSHAFYNFFSPFTYALAGYTITLLKQ